MLKNTLLLLLFCSSVVFSQTVVKDTTTRLAKIIPVQNKNSFTFKSEKPELNQIAGAPKAFYSHYWEFGDGNFSTKEEPNHTYKESGEYEVKLWATNNYDSGKTPTTRPQKVKTNDKADASENEIQLMGDNIVLRRNREPLPDEEFVVILSYKNEKDYVTNGKIYFYYNEKEFKNDNFDLIETRNYHNETVEEISSDLVNNDDFDNNNSFYASSENIIYSNTKFQDTTVRKNLPLSLEEAKQKFKKGKTIAFTNMNPNEQRNIFFTLKTTPEMIKDTSAILKVRSIYVPDSNYENHKIKDMEMEIVTSHDPNKMSTNGLFINYRLVRFKRVKFKTRFQNNGEGPAKTIRLETDVPDMFDKTTLQIESMYPECPICPKNQEVRYSCLDTIVAEKQIIFTFKNIYLPGSEQKNVTEKDSTKGFVKYSLKFGKDFHKVKTKSRTAIIFDKNDPIITNYSVTRFNPGISIGAKVGYNYFPKLDNAKSYFVGATISPYKSYRWYWQSELLFNKLDYNGVSTISEFTQFEFNPSIQNPDGTVSDIGFERKTITSQINRLVTDIVPISLRYNVNNYIGIGFGPQLSTTISSKQETTETYQYYQAIQNTTGFVPDAEIPQLKREINTSTKEKTQVQTQLLADVTLGFARIGPSLGIRYYKNLKSDFDSWQFYAIWKF
ncbi:PKD domain-containing protein [Flavobacterium ponti]|uniref:PKD domain-containing protein n=1 Tax=Flavobacterium ponti TaxID=665133 RepID=A0ABV9P3D7_9FLAO